MAHLIGGGDFQWEGRVKGKSVKGEVLGFLHQEERKKK